MSVLCSVIIKGSESELEEGLKAQCSGNDRDYIKKGLAIVFCSKAPKNRAQKDFEH